MVAPPTSSVASLPAVINTTSFTLSWSGTDSTAGGGIVSYNVYDSTNGGAFKALLTNTTATSTTFTGVFGASYGFYSVATDKAGFTQPTPTAAQALTSLQAPNSPPVATGQSVVTGENDAKAITLSATDSTGDPLIYEIVSCPRRAEPRRDGAEPDVYPHHRIHRLRQLHVQGHGQIGRQQRRDRQHRRGRPAHQHRRRIAHRDQHHQLYSRLVRGKDAARRRRDASLRFAPGVPSLRS